MIIRPWDADVELALLLPLAAAVSYALAIIVTRSRCLEDSAVALALVQNVIFAQVALLAIVLIGLAQFDATTVAAYPFLLRGWEVADRSVWLMIVGTAATHIVGAIILTRVYQVAEASKIAPLEYSYLAIAPVIDFVIWRVVPVTYRAPASDIEQYDQHRMEISQSLARAANHAAADVTRRLLPTAEAHWREGLQWQAERYRYDAARTAAKRALLAIPGAAQGYHYGTIYGPGWTADVSSAESVTLRTHGLPIGRIIAMIQAAAQTPIPSAYREQAAAILDRLPAWLEDSVIVHDHLARLDEIAATLDNPGADCTFDDIDGIIEEQHSIHAALAVMLRQLVTGQPPQPPMWIVGEPERHELIDR